MKRNKFFQTLCLLLMLMGAPAMALGQQAQYLTVTDKAGTTASFLLAEQPVITLGEGTLTVVCGTTTYAKSLDEVAKYSFSTDDETDAIAPATVTDAAARPQIAGGEARFTHLQAGSRVVLTTIDGRQVSAAVADDAGTAVVVLGSLPQGIYVVATPGGSYKITKK